MKKIVLLGLLVVGLLMIAGCTQEQLTQEEKEILGEDGAIAGQATYDKAKLNECRRDKQCWSDLLSCYRAECSRAKDRGACINSCLDRAMGTSSEDCTDVENELNDCQQDLALCQDQLEEFQAGVKYRLFEEDRAKIGYHLQFYETGVVAAFGVANVVDSENLVVELSGDGYDDTMRNVALGETIRLETEDGSEVYFITIDDIQYIAGNSAVDVRIVSESGTVKNRLFEEDRAKIGYHLQFYETGVVAAFGVANVVDGNNLVVELSGRDYDDTMQDVTLGETVELVTEDESKTYQITIDDIQYIAGNSVVDVAIQG